VIFTPAPEPWVAGNLKNVRIKINFTLVDALLNELDPEHDGDVTEDEFLLILKYIQQRSKQKITLPTLSISKSGSQSPSS